VNLCWSSSNYPGSWAYTGLKWQVVLPCSKSCTCCQASSESQCLPSASYTCCAAAVLPPGQLCCDPALGIAGVSFGPTGFIVANIVPYGTPFTITFSGCGLSNADSYVFVPFGSSCSVAALGSPPQGQPGPLVAQLQFNGITAAPGSYGVCYGYSGAWVALPGQVHVAGPASFATTPSPPVANQPFTLAVQGLQLSLSDTIFWLPTVNGSCTSASNPQLITATNTSGSTVSFQPVSLAQGVQTLCYKYGTSMVTLATNFMVYPGPSILGVYAPSLANADGTLQASTCMVAQAGYYPLVAGHMVFTGSAGTFQTPVTFFDEVPAQVRRTPVNTTVNPVYGCATIPIPASVPIGSCFTVSAQATDSGGNSVSWNSTGNLFCTRSIPPPALQQFTINAPYVLVSGPIQFVSASLVIVAVSSGYTSATGLLVGPGGISSTFTVTGGTVLGGVLFLVNASIPFPVSAPSGTYTVAAFTVQDAAFNYKTYNQQALLALPGASLSVVLCRTNDAICAPYVCPGCFNGKCLVQSTGRYCACNVNYETDTNSSALCSACIPIFSGSQCQTVSNNTAPVVVPDGSTLSFSNSATLTPPITFAAGPAQLGTSISVPGMLGMVGPVTVYTPLTLNGGTFGFESVQFAGGPLSLPSPGTVLTLGNASFITSSSVTGAGMVIVTSAVVSNASVQLQCPLSVLPTGSLAILASAVHVASPAILAGSASLDAAASLLLYASSNCVGFVALSAFTSSFVQFVGGASTLSNAAILAPMSIGPAPSGSPYIPALLSTTALPPVVSVNSSQLGSIAIVSGTGSFACGAASTSYSSLSVGAEGTLAIVAIGTGAVGNIDNSTGARAFNAPALQTSASTFFSNITSDIPNTGVIARFPIITPPESFNSLVVRVSITALTITNLVIDLISPSGTTVVLFQKPSAPGANLNTNFSDSAPASVANTNARAIGTTPALRPVGQLSAIKSPQPGGQWVLQIQDKGTNAAATGSVEILNSWGIDFITASASNSSTNVATCTYGGQLHLVPDPAYVPRVNDSFVLVQCALAQGDFTAITHEFGEAFTPNITAYSPNLVVMLNGPVVTSTPTPIPTPEPVVPLRPEEPLALVVGIALICFVMFAGLLVLIMWRSRIMTNGIDSLAKWYPTRYDATKDGPGVAQYGALAEEDDMLPDDLSLPVPAVPSTRRDSAASVSSAEAVAPRDPRALTQPAPPTIV